MRISVKKLNAYAKGFILISLLSIFLFSPSFSFAEEFEPIKVKGKKYDITYFYKIEGDVFGQAAPGVELVLVNGKPIPIDKNLVFKTKVTLDKGQKYLIIETHYKGLRFIKKYLVIRHPRAQKTFKVSIPQEEFIKIVERETAAEEKRIAARKAVKKKPLPKKTTKPTTLKAILEKGSPEVITVKATLPKGARPEKQPQAKGWWDRVKERFSRKKISTEEAAMVMEQDAKKIVRQEAVLIVEKNAQRIIEGEARKYIEKKIPKKELKELVRKQAKKDIEARIPKRELKKIVAKEANKIIKKDAKQIIKYEAQEYISKEAPKLIENAARQVIRDKYPDKEILALLKREAPKILEKEVGKIIARDLPAGEGLSVIKKEIRKIVNQEAPKIIEKETRKIIMARIPTAEMIRIVERKSVKVIEDRVRYLMDKDALWQIAKQAVKNEALKAVDKAALQRVAKEAVVKKALSTVDEAALKKAAAKILDAEVKKLVNKYAGNIIRSETKRLIAEKVKAAGPIRVKAPKLLSPAGKWAGYDLVIELEPGKILLVKREKEKYVGFIYYVDKLLWIDLDEINYKQFKALLEKGTIPPSLDPENKI